jgi:hypothetical protein
MKKNRFTEEQIIGILKQHAISRHPRRRLSIHTDNCTTLTVHWYKCMVRRVTARKKRRDSGNSLRKCIRLSSGACAPSHDENSRVPVLIKISVSEEPFCTAGFRHAV